MPRKRLFRSNDDRMLAGVCGGIAEYFNLDPSLIRLGWVLLTLVFGTGFIVYLAAGIIVPEKINWKNI